MRAQVKMQELGDNWNVPWAVTVDAPPRGRSPRGRGPQDPPPATHAALAERKAEETTEKHM